MLDGKNYMKTMESLEIASAKLQEWAKGQGLETEERSCIYCGKRFSVKRDSPQLWHSTGCRYINGPKGDNTWGGKMRVYKNKYEKTSENESN